MNAPHEANVALHAWGDAPTSRVPGWVYCDPAVYAEELDRFFYRGHWSYVGLACEVPNAGDFKRTRIGERSVILVRDEDGALRVVENRCAHRGAAFCRERQGNVKRLVCPYHQWNYNLRGELIGLPFRNGLRRPGGVTHGGMPEDFDPAQHGLTALRVAERGGAVFACFDVDAPKFEDYVGPEVLAYFDRVFHGRPLRVLGVNRQRIPANWKLMQENIKDPYHPGLLHTWFVTFGLWRADQTSQMVVDARGRHAAMVSRRNAGAAGEVTQGVASYREKMQLNDPRLLDVVPEPWWGEPTVVMTTIFPSLIVQQQVNSLSTRQILPAGPGAFDFVWTHFGFEDDDEAMTRRRLRQANLFGPAGFVSADDGEIIEFIQQGFARNPQARTLNEQDGRGEGEATPHMITETLIRGMYGYWRQVMGR